MGRGLALNPRLLLLDEPLEGLAPMVATELLGAIRAMVAEGGMAVPSVEQRAARIPPLTRETTILDRGRVVRHGPSDAPRAAPKLLERWLGVAAKP